MKARLAGALAAVFAVAQLAAMPAYAEQSPFRAPEARTFTASELQAYGMDRATVDRAAALQSQGYEIRALTEEEAANYQAGITDNQWIWLGILAGVIVIAVAVAD